MLSNSTSFRKDFYVNSCTDSTQNLSRVCRAFFVVITRCSHHAQLSSRGSCKEQSELPLVPVVLSPCQSPDSLLRRTRTLSSSFVWWELEVSVKNAMEGPSPMTVTNKLQCRTFYVLSVLKFLTRMIPPVERRYSILFTMTPCY